MGSPVYVPAPYSQTYPAIAFNGTNFQVTWTDYRSTGADEELYGTRLTRDGRVQDLQPSKISSGEFSLGLATDGAAFLSFHTDFYGMRVRYIGGDGTPAPTNSFAGGFYSDFKGAFNSGKYLLVWTTETELRGTFLDRYGVPFDTNGFLISAGTNYWGEVNVAPMGENWFVVWADRRIDSGNIYGAVVNPQGVMLAPNPILISGAQDEQRSPSICCTSNACLVLWLDSRPQNYNFFVEELYGARISTNGQVLDPAGVKFTTTYSDTDRAIAYKSLSSDGTNWMLLASVPVSGYDSRVVAAKITPQMVATWSTVDLSTFTQSAHVALAFAGTNYQAVWEHVQGQAIDIVGTRLDLSGGRIDGTPQTVSIAQNRQLQPAIASDGTNFLLVWSDGRRGDGQWDIYGARINSAGELLDPDGFAVTTLPTAEINPVVAFDGTCYLVVWEDTRASSYYHKIYAARVSIDGRVLDTNGFPLSTSSYAQINPTVASTGKGGFQVGWGLDLQYWDHLHAVGVSSDGQVLNPSRVLSTNGVYSRFTSDGTNYLFHVAAIPTFNLVVNGAGVVVSSNANNGADGLAGGSGGYLTAFQSPYGIYGVTLDAMSTPQASFQLSWEHYLWNGYALTAAAAGRDFLMAFGTNHYRSTDLFVSQVTRGARVAHTNGVLAASEVNLANTIALGASRDRYLLAYTCTKAFDIARLYYRVITQPAELQNSRIDVQSFRADVHGPIDRIYEVQTSTNLQTWNVLGRVTNAVGPSSFSVAPLPGRAFFRVRESQ